MSALPPGGKLQLHSAAFAKCYRLTKTDEFSSVFSFRKAFRSNSFLLHYRPRSIAQIDGARLGLVVAKRFVRRSVDRNLIRRLIREIFRTQRAGLPALDLVIRLAAKPVFPLDRQVLAGEIGSLLNKLRTLDVRP